MFITLVAIHNILGIYRIVFEPLVWLHYNVNPTTLRFSGIFACHLEKWPPWPIHSFFMVAPYLKKLLWSWSTPVPSFILLHINPQFLHIFSHICWTSKARFTPNCQRRCSVICGLLGKWRFRWRFQLDVRFNFALHSTYRCRCCDTFLPV